MALSLMLRNNSKLRGLAALPRSTFQIQKAESFTHLVTKNNTKALPLARKCKTQFINVMHQTKRNMSADHSKLWTIERIVSLILLGVVPATFFYPNPILDNIFALSVVMHFHWGMEACIVDYVRPIIVGPVLPKIALVLLYLVSASTLGALLYFNQTQGGIGCTLRRFWCITGTPADNEGSADNEAPAE